MKFLHTVAAFIALSGTLNSASAQQIVVIANPALTTLSAGDVSEIFLGDKQLAGSVKLVPVDNSAQQEAFLAKFLNLDAAKYKSAWAKKAFRDGLTAPAVKGGDTDLVEFVKRTPGAVGYVKGPAPAGVAVVTQK